MPRSVRISLFISTMTIAFSFAFASLKQPGTSSASPNTGTSVQSIADSTTSTSPPTTTTTTTTTLPLVQPSPDSPLIGTDGSAPVVSRVPTADRVIFLTIDDGLIRDPEVVAILKREQIPVALFINPGPATDGQAYFRELVDSGLATVDAHTTDHASLRGRSFSEQQARVCSTTDLFTEMFGRRPTLFRPPFGEWDETTRKAAASCGLRAVVMWKGATNDGRIDLQDGSLTPGDIILMHFRLDLAGNLELMIAKARAEGFRFGRLIDYIGGDDDKTI
ncbi:MAG: polysaccharide deacetylase family protein [Acidimicrobiia bacterium]|nr:polysaccharide deacetylase family protein [Acidimicrobiia bacterium]